MHKLQDGFTFVEILVVTAMIMILSAISFFAVSGVREKALIYKSTTIQNELALAAELYRKDMGFYPPDVNRGWDPGLTTTSPTNPDGQGGSSGANCDHCPEDWGDIVTAQWKGPYIKSWPQVTQWGGKYDYNYWGTDVTRNGCLIPAGLYIGIQGDYSGNNEILDTSEQRMIDEGIDGDGCLNGEVQLLLWPL